MCNMDIGTFGLVWVNQSHPRPWPDFNTEHVCRNFEDIRAWSERNQIPEDRPDDYMQMPEGDVKVWELAP